jgi:acyl-CoA synthetase (AMP-forming)/AMP-acid ligase II
VRSLPSLLPVSSRSDLSTALQGLPATIPQLLAARTADAAADFLIGADFRITFGEADEQSAALAARLLAAGVGKGTRLGLLFPNNEQWLVSWLAAARIGALTVPLSTFSPGVELSRAIRHADVAALLSGPRFADHELSQRLEDGMDGLAASGPELELAAAPYLRWIHVDGGERPSWSRVLPDPASIDLVHAAQLAVVAADSLAIISTSGATADPKAVVHTHGSLVRHAALLAQRRGLTKLDRIYSPMPFFWVGGLTMVLLAAMSSGAAAVVQERFDAGQALELAERERVTQISCWPNAARAMAEHPSFASRDLSSVRGGTLIAALPEKRRPRAPDLAPNLLGMTETGGPHTCADDPYLPLAPELRGTFGRGLPGFEHRVVDTQTGLEVGCAQGELLIRGPLVMDGLYKRERHETFTADGWYPTGDLGRFDYDGYLSFTGRLVATIKTGGSNVSPAEVESALLEFDGVRAAFVFGVPAEERGEDVAAVVAIAPGAVLDTDALTTHARGLLSPYKVPRHWRILEEAALPMLPTGKVDMTALRALVAQAETDRSGGADASP